MNNWYECRVKFEKTLENGTQKKVTEVYLVDAMSFTEAENRLHAQKAVLYSLARA